MSRVRFASRNYFSSVLLAAASMLVAFAATPWLLRWLGEERFGAYRVAADWYGYLTFLEFGIGGALLPLLARALGSNQREKVPDLLAASVRAYLGVASCMLAAGLLLAAFMIRLVRVSPQHASDLRWGCLLGLVNLFWLPLSAPFRSLMEARQRSYWVNLLLGAQSLLATGVGLLLAWMKWGITGQFAAWVVGGAVFNAALIWNGARRYPGVLRRAVTKDFDKAAARDLWKLNTPTYVLNLCGRISLLTDNIVVAAILGPVMVVPLILTQKLSSLAQSQLQGLGNATWAGLAELHARGEHDTFERRVVELTSITSILGVASLAPIAAFNGRFVSLWVGPSRYGGELMTLFAVLNPFLLSLISLWGWVLTGTGEVRRFVRPLIAQTLFNFMASVLLTKPFGAVGPLIGTFIGFTTVTVWYLPLELRRAFHIDLGRLTKAVVLPLALGIPYGAGLWLWVSWYTARGWWDLIGEMLLAAVVYLVSVWFLILSPTEREAWRSRMQLSLFGRPDTIPANTTTTASVP